MRKKKQQIGKLNEGLCEKLNQTCGKNIWHRAESICGTEKIEKVKILLWFRKSVWGHNTAYVKRIVYWVYYFFEVRVKSKQITHNQRFRDISLFGPKEHFFKFMHFLKYFFLTFFHFKEQSTFHKVSSGYHRSAPHPYQKYLLSILFHRYFPTYPQLHISRSPCQLLHCWCVSVFTFSSNSSRNLGTGHCW